LAIDIVATIGTILVAKMLFYYFIDLVDKGIKYLTAKKDYKEPVQDILSKLSNDNSFIDKVSDMLDTKRGIDNTTADKIIKLPFVQNEISKNIGDLDRTELENQLKTIFLKSWADKSITDRAIEKVKKDIK
jgi:hypothetical protein